VRLEAVGPALADGDRPEFGCGRSGQDLGGRGGEVAAGLEVEQLRELLAARGGRALLLQPDFRGVEVTLELRVLCTDAAQVDVPVPAGHEGVRYGRARALDLRDEA